MDLINEITRKSNEMIKNINSRSPTNLRTFAPRRDSFDGINKNKEKLKPSPSKSREPQGLAAGEQAGIEILKNELKSSKNYIEYLKKELDNTEFLSQKALRINGKIIQKEDKVRELEKKNT